jgi:hypothetical protein
MQFYRFYGAQDQPIVMHTAMPVRPASPERQEKVDWRPDAASGRCLGDLREISEICRTSRLTCVFLTQPNAYDSDAPQELRDRFWMTPPVAAYTLTLDSLIHVAHVYNRALIDFAKQNSHPLCDLAPRIAPTTENFFDEVHFAAAGSARVAEIVTECVKPLVVAVP